MKHDHIMLDLETMGMSKDAAIISIGAVRFNPEENSLGDTFYRMVNLKSAMRAGGKIDAEVIMWWLQQSEIARGALTGDDGVLIDTALRDLSEWIRKDTLEGLWGNGADFDNVILESAYQRLGWTAPWTYKTNRCYRTIAARVPGIVRETFRSPEDTHHNALADAITQAKHLCAIWKTK